MHTIQPGRQRPGWVFFALVDGGAIQEHGAAWKGVTDGLGRVPTQGQEQMISFRQWSGYQQRDPLGVPVKNGALLYAPAGAYSCVLRSCRLELLTWRCPEWSASLRSVQGAYPLAPRCGYPITRGRFFSAGHAKHGATPSGVFDWTQSDQSRAWGFSQPAFRNIQKDIPETLLAYDNSSSLNLLSMYDIMFCVIG